MTKEMWIEANRDALEKAYNELFMICIREDGIMDQKSGNWKALHEMENSLVALGILEADEEPEDEEEDLNTSTNWAEWELDHMIDRYMEDRMAYEV